MKLNYLSILMLLSAMCFTFTSCDDDENNTLPVITDETLMEDGLTAHRAFILCEGSYNSNNSHLTYLNPNTQTTWEQDIYELRNNKKIGDTAQGMVTYGTDIYYVVSGSKYVVRLDASAKELARYSFTAEQGDPRFLTVVDDKVYVTAYGGYIVRLDAKTLKYETQVATDANPEQIVAHGGKLYCVNSGFGAGHTMSVVNIEAFDKAESVEIMSNPTGICEAGGKLFIMYYDASYNSCIDMYYDGKLTNIGYGGKMASVDGKLYYASSTSSDYITYTTTYSVYNPSTAQTSTWNLDTKSASDLFNKQVVYMIACDQTDGSFYIGTTDYFTDGTVSHFDKDGQYLGCFSARGINPNSMAFIRLM